MRGQTTLWEIVMRNLIDNALRYSPAHATVQVRVHKFADGRVTVSVGDSGPGLSEEDTARLGQLFFRANQPEGQNTSGSGLGWSIVQHIAQRLHLSVSLGRSSALGGLEVSLTTSAQGKPETMAP